MKGKHKNYSIQVEKKFAEKLQRSTSFDYSSAFIETYIFLNLVVTMRICVSKFFIAVERRFFEKVKRKREMSF